MTPKNLRLKTREAHGSHGRVVRGDAPSNKTSDHCEDRAVIQEPKGTSGRAVFGSVRNSLHSISLMA